MIRTGRLFAAIMITATPLSAQSIDDTFAECARHAAGEPAFIGETREIDSTDAKISYVARETDLGFVTIKLLENDPLCTVMGARFTPDHRYTTADFSINEAALTAWVIGQAEKPRHTQVFAGLGAKTVICDKGDFLRQVSISSAGTDDEEQSFMFVANSTEQNPVVCE